MTAILLVLLLQAVGTKAMASERSWMGPLLPIGRSALALAYDSARGKTVLFGGSNGSFFSDTWEWDGTTWAHKLPATSPQARDGHALAYDSARGKTVLFGGEDNRGTPLGDTWEWDGSNWTRKTPATSPAARVGLALAYDALRGKTVLFGGYNGANLSDTWEWDGTAWTQIGSTTSPPARNGLALAYDNFHGKTILFGGFNGSVLSDTWEWDGTTWTPRLPATSPQGRSGHALAYDGSRHKTLLFGGEVGVGSGIVSDTWEWDGTTWVPRTSSTSPQARKVHALAYDSIRGKSVLVGGLDASSRAFADTWEWDGTIWALKSGSPPERYSHAMAYDSGRGKAVLFGGDNNASGRLSDTWEWDGTSWTQKIPGTSPQPRFGPAVAYDSARGETVLFGGTNFSDTWEWNGTTWTQDAPATSPSFRAYHAMAYDSARAKTVLFGGSGSSLLADTWEWDGTRWTQRASTTSPSARSSHAMAYDSARGKTVLFGGLGSSGDLSDTWEYDGASWAQKSPGTSPLARHFHALAYDSTRGRTVLFGGLDSGGSDLSDTWEYDGTNWTQLSPQTSPLPRSQHALAYDTARGRTLLFGGDNRVLGLFSDTWELSYLRPEMTLNVFNNFSGIAATTSTAPTSSTTVFTPLAIEVVAYPASSGFQFQNPSRPSTIQTTSFELTCDQPLGPQQNQPGNSAGPFAAIPAWRPGTAGQPGNEQAILDAVQAAGLDLRLLALPAGFNLAVFFTPDSPDFRPPATAVTLTWNAGAFQAPQFPGTYTFTSQIVDLGGNSAATSSMLVEISAIPPVASITLDGISGAGPQVVFLDGRASTGSRLAYAWSLSSGPNGAALLASSAPVVTYPANLRGNYTFALTVTDAAGRAASAVSTFAVNLSPPVARLRTAPSVVLTDPTGQLASAATTAMLHLDGSSSQDLSSNNAASYRWTLLGAPLASSVNASFGSLGSTGPRLDVPLSVSHTSGPQPDAGVYSFVLLVTGAGGTAPASASVQVLDPNNLLPHADAGLDQSILVQALSARPLTISASVPDVTLPPPSNFRAYIRLDGRASVDPNGARLSYQWTAASFPPGASAITLSDPAAVTPTFVAATPGDYVFALVVRNGTSASFPAQTTIRITNPAIPSLPDAEAVAKLLSGTVGTRNAPLVARAGLELVTLDGTLSFSPDHSALAYHWSQTGGRPVELVHGAANARPAFVPPAPDTYQFALVVSNRAGLASSPFTLAVRAQAAGSPATVRVVSSGSSPTSTGQDFAPENDLALPSSLSVSAGTPVTLSVFARPTGGTLNTFAIDWRQVDGPQVLLVPMSPLEGALSAVGFTPGRAAVYTFEVRAIELDPSDRQTGFTALRDVHVVVNGTGAIVPQAVISLLVKGKLEGRFTAASQTPAAVLQPGDMVTLDGSNSVELNPPPAKLSYHWVQVQGPKVVLSNATSAVTTFVLPDRGDGNEHGYTFELFVDDGIRSIPAPVEVVAFPRAVAALEHGLGSISVPLNPSTASHNYDSSDLLRDTSAVALVRVGPAGGFELYHPALSRAPFAIEGTRGYLVLRNRPASTLSFSGSAWTGPRTLTLDPGLNLVAYPPPIPSAATLGTLGAASSAAFVLRVGGTPGLRPYLPGLSPDAPLELGRAYLLSVPAAVTLSLPAGP